MGSHGSSHRNSHQKPTSPPYRLGFSLPLLGLLERGLDGHPRILSISNIIKQLQSQRYLGLSKPDLKARSNAGSYDVKLLAVGCLLLAMQHWWGRQSFMKNIHNRHWLFPKVKEIAHLCDLCDAQSWVCSETCLSVFVSASTRVLPHFSRLRTSDFLWPQPWNMFSPDTALEALQLFGANLGRRGSPKPFHIVWSPIVIRLKACLHHRIGPPSCRSTSACK